MSAHEKYMNELPNDVEALEEEIERLTADNEMVRDELEKQYARVEELEGAIRRVKLPIPLDNKQGESNE